MTSVPHDLVLVEPEWQATIKKNFFSPCPLERKKWSLGAVRYGLKSLLLLQYLASYIASLIQTFIISKAYTLVSTLYI